MYTIFKTVPAKGGNVGDLLIGQATEEILDYEYPNIERKRYTSEDELIGNINTVNESDAIIMPGFAIRDVIWYPKLYELIKEDQLETPIYPMGAGWNAFPGNFEHTSVKRYPDEVNQFYHDIAQQTPVFSTREYYSSRVLHQLGIKNTQMIGDCAWYDIESLGESFHRPLSVDKLIFTTPHSTHYQSQAKEVLSMLSNLFPNAEKIFALHAKPGIMEAQLADHAVDMGFSEQNLSHDVSNLTVYNDADLHVGYRCHGHIAALRKRIPSVLVAEDGRGMGFSYSLGGVGGFQGYNLRIPITASERLYQPRNSRLPIVAMEKILREGFNRPTDIVKTAIAPADTSIPDQIKQFIEEEINNNFRRYEGMGEYLDMVYEDELCGFISTLPTPQK